MGKESEITFSNFALTRYSRQAFLAIRKVAEAIYRQNDISQRVIPDSAINRWNDISLKRYIVMMFRTLSDISFQRYIVGTMYRWNDLSSDRDIAGNLRYLIDLSFLRCQENERYIGDISEEQSAINDDNRLRYFCTVLYILNNKIITLTYILFLFVCLFEFLGDFLQIIKMLVIIQVTTIKFIVQSVFP